MTAQPFETESHVVEAPDADALPMQSRTDDVPPAFAAAGLQQHPLSKLFPEMSDEDFQVLKDSIENIGVQNPITLHEGFVADGWHRYRAATELCMPCPAVQLGDVDPRDFVKAQNKARRHLSAGQWAQIEVKLWNWRPVGRPNNAEPGAEFPGALKTTAELAEQAGVSTRTIEHAKAVEATGADQVKAAVQAGELSVKRGAAIAKLPKDEQAIALRKPREKKSIRARQPGKGESVKRQPAAVALTPEQQAAAEEAAANAEAAFGDVELSDILDETMAELEQAKRELAAAAADDLKAEAMKWRRISDIATRRQNEIQQSLVDRESELKRLMNIIRRVGKLVGEDDPSRVVAAVAAKLRCTEVSA